VIQSAVRVVLLTMLAAACRPAARREGATAPAVRDTSPIFYDASSAGSSVTRELIVDQSPVFLSGPAPSYPDELRQARVEGGVVLRCIIDRTGKVERSSIEVVFGVHMGFIEAGRQALRRAQFRPGQVRGQPVRTLVHVPYDFKITGSRH
jgi:protein TonB